MEKVQKQQPKTWRKVKVGGVMTTARLNLEKIKTSDYEKAGHLPIFDQGSDAIAGYTNNPKAEYKGNSPAILFGDHTLKLKLAEPPFAIGADGIQILEPDETLLDRRFFYYALKSLRVRSYGYERHLKYLRELQIYFPDIKSQKRIAEILSAFDDKIELNNKINQNLDQMAQAIFNEWFVKFKFPDYKKTKMINSELGKIPEGWIVKQLGDGSFTEVISNGVDKFNGEKIYLATADVENQEICNEKIKINYNKRPSRADMQPVINSIWFAKMVNTYKILFFFEKNKEDLQKYILSTGFMGIKCNYDLEFLIYLLISSKKFHNLKDTLVQGAVQEALTIGNIKRVKILIPSKGRLIKFNQITKPMFGEIYKNKSENQKLSSLRDLLLPKLISGEIKV